jgi:hypothetical protein
MIGIPIVIWTIFNAIVQATLVHISVFSLPVEAISAVVGWFIATTGIRYALGLYSVALRNLHPRLGLVVSGLAVVLLIGLFEFAFSHWFSLSDLFFGPIDSGLTWQNSARLFSGTLTLVAAMALAGIVWIEFLGVHVRVIWARLHARLDANGEPHVGL